MSYKTMADALLAMLREKSPSSTYVTSTNSSAKSDWDLLNRGENVVVVFEPGAAPRTPGSDSDAFGDYYTMDWNVNVHVVAKILDGPSELHDVLVTTANAIIDAIDAWKFLNGTANCEIAFHRGWDEPAQFDEGNGPHGVRTIVHVTIREQILTAAQE